MKAEMFQVGDIIDQFAGSQTGIMFDIIDEMGMLFFVVDESQVQQYKLGGHYDFWCTSYNDTVAFFAVNFATIHGIQPLTLPTYHRMIHLIPIRKGREWRLLLCWLVTKTEK